jgi:hypothetical protein
MEQQALASLVPGAGRPPGTARPGLSLEDHLYPTAGVSLDTLGAGARARSPLDMEARERGRMEVQVAPAVYHRQTSSRMPTYDMTRRPRGAATRPLLTLPRPRTRYRHRGLREQRAGAEAWLKCGR